MDLKSIAIEIKDYLNKNLNIEIKDVIVFGSSVSGDNNSNSDLDVLIITNEITDFNIITKVNNLCYDLDLIYDTFIDSHIISDKELGSTTRGKHPVFDYAIQNGIHA